METTLTLRKALQRKNRLASKIQKLRNQIRQNNVNTVRVLVDSEGKEKKLENERTVSIDELTNELDNTVHNLINLKTEMATANTKIYAQIYGMSEIKSAITFLQQLPTNNGTKSNYEGGFEINKAHVTNEDVLAQVVELEESLESMQDEVDHYNATTEITVDLL